MFRESGFLKLGTKRMLRKKYFSKMFRVFEIRA